MNSEIKKEIGYMVRDFTAVGSQPKSVVKRRIEAIYDLGREEGVKIRKAVDGGSQEQKEMLARAEGIEFERNRIKELLPKERETGIKMYPDKRTKEMRYLHGNSPSSQCIGCGQKKKAEERGFNEALREIKELLK